jgi:C4-dicarboxylate-specific signal transduction histidine kinase
MKKVLTQIDPAVPLYFSLQAVQQAAQRSAALTRQLLAFARKQTVAPKVIDISETVAGMLNMLRRLIGEDIDLLWQPGEKRFIDNPAGGDNSRLQQWQHDVSAFKHQRPRPLEGVDQRSRLAWCGFAKNGRS